LMARLIRLTRSSSDAGITPPDWPAPANRIVVTVTIPVDRKLLI
jgi:hypothetical protein